MKKPTITMSFDSLGILSESQWGDLIKSVEKFETHLNDCFLDSGLEIEMNNFDIDCNNDEKI
jgi:hypothetical protein